MLMTLVRARARRRDDRGSVALAMVCILVMTMLLAATVSVVNSSLNKARIDQDRNNAFQFASAGVDHAVYRIDADELPTVTTGSYEPVNDGSGNLIGFRDSVDIDGSTFEIEALKTPPTQDRVWTVRSLGTDPSGRERQAVTTIESKQIFVNAFFVINKFDLTGNQTTPIAYYSSLCPDPRVAPSDPNCDIPPKIPGFLGTNEEIEGSAQTIKAFADNWGGFHIYGSPTQADADSRCGSVSGNTTCSGEGGTVVAITDRLEIEVPDPPANVQPCPAVGGNIGGTLQPGDYICDSAITMNSLTVGSLGNGSGQVRLWLRNSFSASSGAVINAGQPALKLQIYQYPQADGSPWSGSVCGAQIWAMLYAPGLEIKCSGVHQPEIYGAVLAHVHGGTGNQFHFHYDVDSARRLHDARYVVKNWRECPPTATDC